MRDIVNMVVPIGRIVSSAATPSASAALATVAHRFTTSLSIHNSSRWWPRVVPQLCTARSVSLPHGGQELTRCGTRQADYPPAGPQRRRTDHREIARVDCWRCSHAWLLRNHHHTYRAGASESAGLPRTVTPPDVPGDTICSLVRARGGAELSVPTSVAQVSAVAAARAPTYAPNSYFDRDGMRL